MERMNHEEEIHQRHVASQQSAPKWANRTDSFFSQRTGYVAQPAETSAARLFTSQRAHLKPERYNVYSDPKPDPFKAEYHARPERDVSDENIVTNVAKINPFQKEELVANLKSMKGKETNFTDYQLYFRDGIREQVDGVESPRDNDPLYSSFTASRQFDPNIWLPPHMAKYGRGRDIVDDTLSMGSMDLSSVAGLSAQSSFAGSVDEKPGSRPGTAQGDHKAAPSDGERKVVAMPAAVKAGTKAPSKRPSTSIPSRGSGAGTKGGGSAAGKPALSRPWTSGGSRGHTSRPTSMAQTVALDPLRPRSAVRTGAWQLLGQVGAEQPQTS